MSFFRKHKWILHWSALMIIVAVFIFLALFFEDKPWIGNILQTVGTIAGVYLTILIFLISKEGSDKQFRAHLEELQKLNTNQINALEKTTNRQIEKLQELNERHIDELNNSTQRQVDVIQESTYAQISAFEKQITEVTNELTNNSILLAEILSGELEKLISRQNESLARENQRLTKLQNWKLLRTPEERDNQLKHQFNRIKNLQNWNHSLVRKYREVRKYLGNNGRYLE